MNRTEKSLNTCLTVLFVAALAVVVITVAIGVPIYCRFFYYIQIKTLDMERYTGWSYETIKNAYDDVLNYLTLPGFEFGTGTLKWSESGMSHFADCKVLFNLNLYCLIGGAVVALVLGILDRVKVISLVRFRGFRPAFFAGIISLALPIVLILLVLAVGFDRAFEVFHAIFFPGKTNWLFNPRTDEIILVMPQQFFMNCAIIIAVTLVAISVGMIVYGAFTRGREKGAKTDEQSKKAD